MTAYRLDIESDGNLGIYFRAAGSQSEVWVGNILEPESPNPALALGMPLGILGVRKVLDLLKKWQAAPPVAAATRSPSARSLRCRAGTRKWRKTLHAKM
jgi:hypothetical protein